MDFIYTADLSTEQSADIEALYARSEIVSIEQRPGFALAAEPGVAVRYLLAYEGRELSGYACVKIKKRVLASVSFGPVVRDTKDYEEVCKGLISKCRSTGILVLRIMPPYMTTEDRARVESTKAFKFEHSDTEINWGTLTLSLDRPVEDIYKGFRDNHKGSIKKAIKLELKPQVVKDREWITTFSSQHCDMYEKRGLPFDREQSLQRFLNLFDFFEKTGSGYFIVIQEKEKIIGGVCCVIDGHSARYQDGYSHPDYRQYPITHLALYEAIKVAQERGLKYFDFGGYANNVKEGDQLYAINKFKHDFGGEPLSHPGTMMVYTWPLAKKLYSLYTSRRADPA